jgi:predicted DNA binding protein
MYRAKLYVDFDEPGVFDRLTRRFERPFDVLEEEIHDDGEVTFVVDTREHREAFVETLTDASGVSTVETLGPETLLIRKKAKGASVAIRDHHGKLRGVDRVHGTRRVFEVSLFRRSDLRAMVEALEVFASVELGSVVEETPDSGVLSTRQDEAVRTALDIGYFDWPRNGDAEALAEAMGVSHPTALEHLRKGERKLLERALAETRRGTTRRDREFLITDCR